MNIYTVKAFVLTIAIHRVTCVCCVLVPNLQEEVGSIFNVIKKSVPRVFCHANMTGGCGPMCSQWKAYRWPYWYLGAFRHAQSQLYTKHDELRGESCCPVTVSCLICQREGVL